MIRLWNRWKHRYQFGDAGAPATRTDRVAAVIQKKLALRRGYVEELRHRYRVQADMEDGIGMDARTEYQLH